MPVTLLPAPRIQNVIYTSEKDVHNRAVARSENPGGLVVPGGDNVPPLVEIGLTDLP